MMEAKTRIGKKPLTKAEILSYGLGGVASTMPSQFKSQFGMAFMSDIAGIPVAIVGIIMMAMTIWDAINDPIIGRIADCTNTKFGKYRPHMMMGGVCSAIVLILMFCAPNLGAGGKIAYYTVLLALFSVFFTQFGVPWQALNSVMSDDTNQRNLLLTSRQLAGFVAGAIGGIIALPIVNAVGGTKGWMVAAIVVAVITSVTAFIAANGAKKRDFPGSIPTPEKMHFKQQAKIILKNKAILCTAVAFGMIALNFGLTNAVTMYYLRCVVGDMTIVSKTSVFVLIASLIIIPFVPMLLRKFNKVPVIIGGVAINLIPSVVLLFLGADATSWQVITLAIIGNVGYSISNIGALSLIPDCIDYTEYNYGTVQAGFVNSSITFMRKFCMAFSTFIVGGLLGIAGYQQSIAPSQEVIDMILNIKIYIPMLLSAICLLMLKLYPITKKYEAKMRAELDIRRAKA